MILAMQSGLIFSDKRSQFCAGISLVASLLSQLDNQQSSLAHRGQTLPMACLVAQRFQATIEEIPQSFHKVKILDGWLIEKLKPLKINKK